MVRLNSNGMSLDLLKLNQAESEKSERVCECGKNGDNLAFNLKRFCHFMRFSHFDDDGVIIFEVGMREKEVICANNRKREKCGRLWYLENYATERRFMSCYFDRVFCCFWKFNKSFAIFLDLYYTFHPLGFLYIAYNFMD